MFEKSLLLGLSWHFQLLFGLWNSLVFNLGELKKRLLVVEMHCYLIFCLLTSPKCGLVEVEKPMIHVVECHFEVILCFLTNQKFDDFQVDKATIQVVEWHLKVIFGLYTRPKF